MNKTIDKPLNVALYIRVSTDRQAKEGDSLEAQEEALRTYAKEHGYIIYDLYIDGGESGQKFNRTNFQRMLNDVRNHRLDMILMTKLDRWFRNPADFYKTAEILKKNKVNWKTIWEDYDTTTASGEFWLNMSLSMARMEAKRTGERIDAIFEHKYSVQKTVCTGNLAYGYKIGKDKTIEIDKEKANNIKLLYEHYINSNNLSETVKWFQSNIEIRSYDSIKLYLKNSAYIGKFVRKRTGEIIEDYYPRILDDETFYEVQRLLKKNLKQNKKNSNTQPYIFSGLLKCSKCHNNLSGKTNHNHHYYVCKKATLNITCNNKIFISELWMEKYLVDNIYRIMNEKILIIKNLQEKRVKTNNDNTIQLLKKKLKKLSDLYINDMIDMDVYKEQYKTLNEKLNDELKQKTPKKEINVKEIENLISNDILSNYYSLSNEDKRKLWLSIIDCVIIKDKQNIEVKLLNFS